MKDNLKHNLLVTVAAALASASALAVTAQAGETDYTGLVGCGHIAVAMLTSTPEVTAYTSDFWAIVPPDNPVKALQNATLHCKSFSHVVQGKTTSLGACVWTDASGDTFIGETVEAPDKEPVWRFLLGTGKWKGVTGGGAYALIAAGKPNPDGSIEICSGMNGKWTLP